MVRPEWILAHPKNIMVFERDQLVPIRLSQFIWEMMALGTSFGAYHYLRASKTCRKKFPWEIQTGRTRGSLNLSSFWPKPRHSFFISQSQFSPSGAPEGQWVDSHHSTFQNQGWVFFMQTGKNFSQQCPGGQSSLTEGPGWLQHLPSAHLQQHLLFTACLFPHGWPELTLLRLQKLKGPEVRKTGNPNSENLSNNVS